MPNILTSVHGRRLGLGPDDELVIRSGKVRARNNSAVVFPDGISAVVSDYSRSWRVLPTNVADSGSQASAILAAMTASSDIPWLKISPSTTRTIVIDAPEFTEDGMLVFELDSSSDITWTIRYSESFDGGSTYSTSVAPTLVQPNTNNVFRLHKFDVSKGTARKIKLTFAHNKASSGTDYGYRYVSSIAMYQFLSNNQHDYVVFVGASISEAAVRHYRWRNWWKKSFNRDAVIFNECISGLNTAGLLAALPAIIARHPKAKYYLVETGGNDVTDGRPFKGTTQAVVNTMRANIASILSLIQATGATPHMSRITYRNYTASPAVSGTTNEENGSKPFNEYIIDPAIRELNGWSYDGTKGAVDPYTFLRDNYHLIDLNLDAAGVHPYGYGAYKLGQYWAYAFGGLIFKNNAQDIADVSSSTGVAGAKEEVIVSFGSNPAWGFYEPGSVFEVDHVNGLTYNAVLGTSTTAGDITSLVNTEGDRCPIGIDITTAFTTANVGGVQDGTDSPYNEEAKLSAAVVDNITTAVIDITGLSNSATYKLTMFSSRSGSGTRNTKFIVGGSNVIVNALGNANTTVQLTGLTPSSGKITLQVQADPATSATFGYLNVLKIERE